MFERRQKMAEKFRKIRIIAFDLATPILEKESKKGSKESEMLLHLLPIFKELTLGTIEVRKKD